MKTRLPRESFEDLSEHLYGLALKGGFDNDFNLLKPHLPYLQPIEGIKELMERIQQGNEEFRNLLMVDLIGLYKTKTEMRPVVVEVLLVIIWDKLTDLYAELTDQQKDNERFADIYWDILNRIKRIKLPTHKGCVDRLIQELRKKFIRQ